MYDNKGDMMDHALQILKEEKFRLMAHIRMIQRNMDECMCNISFDEYQKQLDEVDAAILYAEEREKEATAEYCRLIAATYHGDRPCANHCGQKIAAMIEEKFERGEPTS